MKGLIIALIVIACVLIVLLALVYCITLKQHKNMFGKRFESDKRISFYNKEQFGLDYKEISIPIKKNTLNGGIYSYPNAKDGTLFIYVHGMWSGVRAYVQDIEYFCKQGYQVLALNHEGTDESTGKDIRGLSNSLRCLDYTIKYIKSNEDLKNKKLYVVGHSWGAFATLNIVKYYPDIEGIIAYSPFISINQCMKGMMPKGLSLLVVPMFSLIELLRFGKYAKANAIKSLKKYNGSVVVLHSTNDPMVNYELNTGLLKRKNNKATYIISDNKFHNPQYTIEALKLLGEYSNTMKSLKTLEEKNEYMKNTNYNKLGEIDIEVMDQAFNALMK